LNEQREKTNLEIENENAEKFLGKIFFGGIFLLAIGLIIATYIYL
jgi:hypothetical protein